MFQKTFISNKNEKNPQILTNKPVYLRFSILELHKILIYEFWHEYVKPKYGEKGKLCHVDTDSFIVYIKTDHIYEDIEEDVERKFNNSNNSNYKLDRPLPKRKNKGKKSRSIKSKKSKRHKNECHENKT